MFWKRKNNFLKIAFFLAVLIVKTSTLLYAEKIIKIDGSSTVYPIVEAISEEFQKAKRGEIKITVGISGTGGGFKKFCRGETDISNASRPILKKEMELCSENNIEYIELPIAYDGIVVVVNPKNNWASSITVEELKKIWEPDATGKITKWKQARKTWPDMPLKLYGPGVDSGTFDYFTEAIVGKVKSSRSDFTSSEDDNVLVMGVAGDRYALGFFGYAYYEENRHRLKPVAVVNPETGKKVSPSEKTIKDGTYSPLSRPLFIYINKKSAEKLEIKEFIEFLTKNAPTLVKEVKYIPLPTQAYTKVGKKFKAKQTGTVFNGEVKSGITIEELLKEEFSK